MPPATVDEHYQRALGYIQAADWPAAEGVLLQLRELLGEQHLDVADALGYALLMQGAYQACARVLTPVLTHPARSFWIAHKYGDALRGLHDADGAVDAYRCALAEGSTSPLTARNLLQVLYAVSPKAALGQLDAWTLPLTAVLLSGARAAAALVAGPELIEWLHGHGLAGPSLRRRLAEQRLYRLQHPGDLLDSLSGVTDDEYREGDADMKWCQALQHRLRIIASPGWPL